MCLRPIKISSRKKGEDHSKKVLVPCGWCAECISAKSTAWAIRLQEEERYCTNAYFVTLTYNDGHLPLFNPGTGEFIRLKDIEKFKPDNLDEFYPILYKNDLQKFIKRIRKKAVYENFKYYAVGEYGTKNHRPHYHLILFNLDINNALEKWRFDGEVMGHIKVGNVTAGSIRYCTNYVVNKRKYSTRKLFPEFALMSKGLGEKYIERMKDWHLKMNTDKYTFKGGQQVILPRYFKEKIFDEITLKILGEKNRIEATFEAMEKEQFERHNEANVKTIKLNRSKKSRN